MNRFAALLLAMTLAACAQTAKGPPTAAPTATPPVAVAAPPPDSTPPRERIRRAVDMLGRGEAVSARMELASLLADQPDNALARKLLDQIDRDPRALLGAKNYPYRVRPGDTMSGIAERLMGDPLLFYGLARYNNVADPSQMEVGRTLLIPGTPRKAAAATAAARAPATSGPQRNPTRAAQLRASALEQMNLGAIDKAVGLLGRAQTMDPGNPAIQRDLDRARRIQANVRAR